MAKSHTKTNDMEHRQAASKLIHVSCNMRCKKPGTSNKRRNGSRKQLLQKRDSIVLMLLAYHTIEQAMSKQIRLIDTCYCCNPCFTSTHSSCGYARYRSGVCHVTDTVANNKDHHSEKNNCCTSVELLTRTTQNVCTEPKATAKICLSW